MLEGAVESSKASESRGQRDVSDRQFGLIEQALGEV
jgi:hypothetical protein